MSKDKKSMAALEAILFAMGEPVSLQVLARALEINLSAASEVVEMLKESYKREERGIQLIELDGSYQLCTKPQYYENLITVAATPEKPVLTDTLLETLSIVAYRQPVTKAEINRIRGVSSDHAVSRLVEYGLIREAGRLNAPGRPMLFATTQEFLRRFGMDSLEQLPETPEAEQAAEAAMESEQETEETPEAEPTAGEVMESEQEKEMPETEPTVGAATEMEQTMEEKSSETFEKYEEEDDETEEEDGLEWLQEESSDIDALMAELMGSDSLTSRPSEMEQWVEELLESADSEEEE